MATPTHAQRRRAIEYTLAAILDLPDLASLHDRLVYAPADEPAREGERVRIVTSPILWEGYGAADSIPAAPVGELDGVPFLYGTPEIQREGDRLIVHADLIASAYVLLSRYEEIVRPDARDNHGRFPASESWLARNGLLERPLVDEYARLIRDWMHVAGVEVPEPTRRFKVLLTHDIDQIRRHHNPLRELAGTALGRKPLGQLPVALGSSLRLRPDPFDTFARMIELDDRLTNPDSGVDAEAVYFFMAGGDAPQDGWYDIRSREARRMVRQVIASGAHVGLHTSYDAGQHPEKIAGEKATLEEVARQSVTRNRHHFLGWRQPSEGWTLAEAGFTWDGTMGFPDRPGFRLGVCRPVPLFDPERFELMGIEEHPLTVMECSLSFDKYMGLAEEPAWELADQLLQTTREHNGEFVMLWHNTEFGIADPAYHDRLYTRLIDRILGVDDEGER